MLRPASKSRSVLCEKIPTLVFYARGQTHWKAVVKQTLGGLLAWRHKSGIANRLQPEEFMTLSYLCDWRDALCAADGLAVKLCDVNNLVEFQAGLRRLREYPLIMILHSAAWDAMTMLRRASAFLQDRRSKLIVFFGNEYNCMPAKIEFAREVEADYIATQLPHDAARWLYADCHQSRLALSPPALNPEVYRPRARSRTIDIGFRGNLYANPYALGDLERTRILELFAKEGSTLGLSVDIAFERIPRDDWSDFLSGVCATVGAESGTSYLERDDRTQTSVKAYLKANPSASFEEVFDRFFKSYSNPVSGKAISSRHFEPIGTKTCQLLVEGHYNGILQPDVHYIAIKKDLSNIEDAVARFQDESYRRVMVERTYEYVMDAHTYRHRVRHLVDTIMGDGLAA